MITRLNFFPLPLIFLVSYSVQCAAQDTQLANIEIQENSLQTSEKVTPDNHTQQVLEDDFLTELQPAKIEDIAVYLPNVQSSRLSAGGSEDFILRGFSLGGRLLLDGLIGNQSFHIQDPATLERVEFVKGHSSVLHGAGAPGGTVNYITKKPQAETSHTIQVGVGNFNFKNIVLDSTGAFNPELNYRSILSATDTDTWKENVHDKNLTWLNSLDWRYQKNSNLLISYEFSKQTYPWDFDNVYANEKPVYDVSYVHPKTNASRIHHRLSADWQHTFSPLSWLEVKTHLFDSTRDERQIGFYYLWDDNQPLVGFYQEVDEEFKQASAKLSYHRVYEWQGVSGEWQLGFARSLTHDRFDNLKAPGLFSLDIYHPDFDFTLPTEEQMTERYGEIIWQERALCVFNQTDLSDDLNLSFGARQTQYELKSYRNDYLLGDTEQSNRSYSVGLNWQASKLLELYGSWSESFLPNLGTDRNDNYFDAQEGVQREVGLIFKPSNNLTFQLARFVIQQSNLLTRDPQDPAYRSLAGAYSANGWEMMLTAKLSHALSAELAVGLLDATLTENNDGYEGNDFPSVPKENSSLWLSYQAANDWKFQLGTIYQGRRAGDLANSFYVDSYVRYDLAGEWQVNKQTQLKAVIQNLRDTDYVSYSSAQDFVRFGDPRTIKVTLKHQF